MRSICSIELDQTSVSMLTRGNLEVLKCLIYQHYGNNYILKISTTDVAMFEQVGI
jgi:hypothetical protein